MVTWGVSINTGVPQNGAIPLYYHNPIIEYYRCIDDLHMLDVYLFSNPKMDSS